MLKWHERDRLQETVYRGAPILLDGVGLYQAHGSRETGRAAVGSGVCRCGHHHCHVCDAPPVHGAHRCAGFGAGLCLGSAPDCGGYPAGAAAGGVRLQAPAHRGSRGTLREQTVFKTRGQ